MRAYSPPPSGIAVALPRLAKDGRRKPPDTVIPFIDNYSSCTTIADGVPNFGPGEFAQPASDGPERASPLQFVDRRGQRVRRRIEDDVGIPSNSLPSSAQHLHSPPARYSSAGRSQSCRLALGCVRPSLCHHLYPPSRVILSGPRGSIDAPIAAAKRDRVRILDHRYRPRRQLAGAFDGVARPPSSIVDRSDMSNQY